MSEQALGDWEFHELSRTLKLNWGPIVPSMVRETERWQRAVADLVADLDALAAWDGARSTRPEPRFLSTERILMRLHALHLEKANLTAEVERLRPENAP